MLRMLVLALALAACGSKAPAPAAPAGHPAAAEIPPEVNHFHDLLAKDTCDALPDLHAGADAIAKATPPRTANADTWTTATNQLVAAVAGLAPACQAKDPAAMQAAFAKVHDAFAALQAAASEETHEGQGG